MLKFLRPFLLALGLALSMASASAANASTCYHWQFPGTPFQFCDDLRPDPTPGFTMVASNYVVQDGEVMFCTQNGTWCEKDRLGAGGFYNGNLGADWSPGGIAPVYTVTSRLHRASTLYSGTNFTGSSFSWGPQFNPQYGPTHPTVNPQSFSIQN